MALHKVVEIVTNPNDLVSHESGVPHGDNLGDGTSVSFGVGGSNNVSFVPDIDVGGGEVIQEILTNNGTILNGVKDALNNVNVTLGTNGIKVNGVDKVETEIKNLKDGFVDNIIKQTQEMAKGNALKVASNVLKQASNQSQQEANNKQNQKNDRLIENLDFQKDGKSGFVDTDGNRIKPREAEAKHHVEKAIETEDMNNTSIDDVLSFTEDFFGGVFDDGSDLLGGTDGFNLSMNPINLAFKELEDYLETELEKEINSHG